MFKVTQRQSSQSDQARRRFWRFSLRLRFLRGLWIAIAGDRGLITLPVPILAGAPPLTAITTNKVQSVSDAAMNARMYRRVGHVDLRGQRWVALLAMVGGNCGAVLTFTLPTELIRVALPFFCIDCDVLCAEDESAHQAAEFCIQLWWPVHLCAGRPARVG